MKILCLLVLLANIFLLMLEYRNGAFTSHKENSEQHAIKGKEQILLLRELKKKPHSSLSNPNQKTVLDAAKLDNYINETQRHLNNTNTISRTYPTESSKIQLP
jgi:hypothetical protein